MADFKYKDKDGNESELSSYTNDDTSKLNTVVQAVSLLLEATNAGALDNYATKQYVDEHQSSGLNLFDVVAKDHVLTYGKDLEGFAPLGTWVYKTAVDGSRYGYPDFVQKCLDEYDEATADTITVDSVTLNIKRHANGHIYFDVADIADVNTIYQARGEAWLYGIDEVNERVFLPRSTRIKFGSTSEVGEYQEAGAPNIEGTFTLADENYKNTYGFNCTNDNLSGCFTTTAPLTSTLGYDASGRGNIDQIPKFDASLSNPIYGNSDTIEYSSTKLIPYMVVGNVKVEQASTDVIDVTTTNNDTVPLFTAHYFDYTPNNLSWLKGGEQSNSGDLYKTCYNELVNVLNGETKYGALKVIDQADIVQGEDYSLYWIVDQVNETFRTPTKTQQRFVVKTYQNESDWYRIYNDGWCEQGGYLTVVQNNSVNINFLKPFVDTTYAIVSQSIGSSNLDQYTNGHRITKTSNSTFTYYDFDYGAPASWIACGYIDLTNETFDTSLYFKVANAVENIQMLNVGAVTEALNLRADLSLANVNNNGKIAIAHNAMPSGVYDELTLANNSDYTMPADGFFCMGATSTASSYIYLRNVTKGYRIRQVCTVSGNGMAVMMPVSKNDVVHLDYSINNLESLRFYYANGSESEQV